MRKANKAVKATIIGGNPTAALTKSSEVNEPRVTVFVCFSFCSRTEIFSFAFLRESCDISYFLSASTKATSNFFVLCFKSSSSFPVLGSVAVEGFAGWIGGEDFFTADGCSVEAKVEPEVEVRIVGKVAEPVEEEDEEASNVGCANFGLTTGTSGVSSKIFLLGCGGEIADFCGCCVCDEEIE